MKTPEEIKRRLGLCSVESCSGTCEGCPYVEDEECISHGNREALAYIRKLEAKVPKWVSVKERLPEDVKDGDGYCVNYLVYIPEYRSVDIANYIEEADMWVGMGVPVNVTHWMPLPVLPKEATTDDQ